MKQTIHAQEHELRRVFSNDYLFSIPAYQRPYAWTTEQVSELISDLLAALGDQPGSLQDVPPYFLGSIVLIKDPQYASADVVDGQQRLTTLAILLSVLRDMSETSERQNDLHNYVCEKGNIYEGTEDRFRLTPRPKDAEFFQNLVLEIGATNNIGEDPGELSDPRYNFWKNTKYIKAEAAKLTPEQRDRLAIFTLQRCYLVMVSASDTDSAYRIFKVMNDRGLDLNPTDILKSEIIGAIAPDLEDKYTEIWEGLEDELGRENFSDLFTHIRMIYQKAKARRALTVEFREFVNPLNDPGEFIDNILRPMATVYRMLINSSFSSMTLADEINGYLRSLNRLDNFDWLPPAIVFFTRNQSDPELILRFISLLERLAYGQFILRVNLNERITRYADLLKEIESNSNFESDQSAVQLTSEERTEVLGALAGDIYLLTRVRLPVMLRLDGLVADDSVSHEYKVVTIEHVLPQNPADDSEWVQVFNDDERERFTHKIANLALLSRSKNSQAQNFDFSRKKSEYFMRGGTTTFALTSQVLSEMTWEPNLLAPRQEMLVNLLASEWNLS